MRKVKRSVFSFMVVVLLILGCTITAFAAESSFANKYVSCSAFTYITGDFKDTTSSSAAILLTRITDEAGNTYNNYVTIRTVSGSTPLDVKTGKTFDYTLPTNCQNAGNWVPLYAKGTINCHITGYWNTH